MSDTQQDAVPVAGRWWGAVAIATIAAIPAGWVLSYGGPLPFMLGLFFFALFGLLIGAILYRVGSPARPIDLTAIRVGVGAIVLLCWGLSLWVEVRDFPRDMAERVLHKVAVLPDGMDATALRTDVERFVRATLTSEYGGSGVLGFTRWVVASSRMEYPVETMQDPILLQPPQYRWWWCVRVVLSVVLLTFGIYAQVSPLSRVSDTPVAT